MTLGIGQSFGSQIRDRDSEEEFEQLIATVQRLTSTFGQWNPVTFSGALFWPDAGTWTPVAGDVRLFQWSVIGSTMTVQFHVQNGAASGTVKTLYLRVPNTGYKIVPVPTTQAQPNLASINLGATNRCGIWQNTSVYKPGTVGVVNARIDGIVLACFLDDVSQINSVANAGCFGSISFAVQPAA